MQAHEIKRLVDDSVTVLIDACDTDDVYWSTFQIGQDSEEAEASGYLAGYRDALTAIQRLVGHFDPSFLTAYVEVVNETMRDTQQRVDEFDPEEVHFWEFDPEEVHFWTPTLP